MERLLTSQREMKMVIEKKEAKEKAHLDRIEAFAERIISCGKRATGLRGSDRGMSREYKGKTRINGGRSGYLRRFGKNGGYGFGGCGGAARTP
jgi:hypothetical protein